MPAVAMVHLTLGVMCLESEERRSAACDFLRGEEVRKVFRGGLLGADARKDGDDEEEEKGKPSQGGTMKPEPESAEAAAKAEAEAQQHPFTTTLSGLHAMRSQTSTSILYASPLDPTGRLQALCISLRSLFLSAGFLVAEDRPLLLHATVLNMGYDKNLRGHGKRKIDATELMRRYEGFEWVKEVSLDRLCIWKMGAVEEAMTGDSNRNNNKNNDSEEGSEGVAIMRWYEELESVELTRDFVIEGG